jgi:hypothetical protein
MIKQTLGNWFLQQKGSNSFKNPLEHVRTKKVLRLLKQAFIVKLRHFPKNAVILELEASLSRACVNRSKWRRGSGMA